MGRDKISCIDLSMMLKPLFGQFWHETKLDCIDDLAGVPAKELHRIHYL